MRDGIDHQSDRCRKHLQSLPYDSARQGIRLQAEGDESLIWVASKDGVRLSGYSPPELLGIVTLWEHYGPEWNRQSPNVLDEVLGRS